MDSFLKLECMLTKLAMVFSVLLLSLSATLGIYQVLSRFLFNTPSAWTEVVAIYLVIWSVFLAAATAFRTGMMMSIDVIYKFVPSNKVVVLEFVIGACCLLVMGLLVWFGVELTYRVKFQTMAGFQISMAWAYAALPSGGIFSFIAILGRLVSLIIKQESREVASELNKAALS
jgi:TRAP-type C4-dicarboxylate transport system permease small subunit